MRGASQAVGLYNHLTTPVKPQINKAANRNLVSYSTTSSFDFDKCLIPLALLLCSHVAQGLQESCQDRGDSLRKMVGLNCSQLQKHLRPAALPLNHSSEEFTAVSSERRAIQEPLTRFNLRANYLNFCTILGKAGF